MEATDQRPSIAIDDTESRIINTSSKNEGKHGREAAKDIVFGSIAGIVGKCIEYPFDTVKVRLQSQASRVPLQYTGPLDCFRQSIHQNGFLGLYCGISAPLVGAAMETSSLFFSYRLAQNAMQKAFYTEKSPLPMTALVACGAMSGAFTSLLLTPIELVKCKMQVPSINGHKGLGPMSLITTIYRGEGFLGFWHGQFGTLIRETGGSAAWFGTYEAVTATFRSLAKSKALDSNIPLPLWQQMTAGAAAGMGYNFVFYPADTIKSRMQTEEIESGGTKKKFWAAGRSLWRQQGIKGLYRGCGITVGRAAPSSAFIFAIYEALRGWFE